MGGTSSCEKSDDNSRLECMKYIQKNLKLPPLHACASDIEKKIHRVKPLGMGSVGIAELYKLENIELVWKREKFNTEKYLNIVKNELIQTVLARTLLYQHLCPNIIQFYVTYICPKDLEAHIVIEYAKFGTLKDFIDNGTYVPDSIIFQALFAICSLHVHLNLTHRDLILENIFIDKSNKKSLYYHQIVNNKNVYYKLLTSDYLVKIADFSYAKINSSDEKKYYVMEDYKTFINYLENCTMDIEKYNRLSEKIKEISKNQDQYISSISIFTELANELVNNTDVAKIDKYEGRTYSLNGTYVSDPSFEKYKEDVNKIFSNSKIVDKVKKNTKIINEALSSLREIFSLLTNIKADENLEYVLSFSEYGNINTTIRVIWLVFAIERYHNFLIKPPTSNPFDTNLKNLKSSAEDLNKLKNSVINIKLYQSLKNKKVHDDIIDILHRNLNALYTDMLKMVNIKNPNDEYYNQLINSYQYDIQKNKSQEELSSV